MKRMYMMTDQEKVELLLTELGIGHAAGWDHGVENPHSIMCREGMPKVSGYGGFFAQFEFDENGKIITLGVWE